MTAITGKWRAKSAEAITFQWRSEDGEIIPQRRPTSINQLISGLYYNRAGGVPDGYAWTTVDGQRVTFTGVLGGFSFNSAPVFDDGSHLYVSA